MSQGHCNLPNHRSWILCGCMCVLAVGHFRRGHYVAPDYTPPPPAEELHPAEICPGDPEGEPPAGTSISSRQATTQDTAPTASCSCLPPEHLRSLLLQVRMLLLLFCPVRGPHGRVTEAQKYHRVCQTFFFYSDFLLREVLGSQLKLFLFLV